MNIIPAHAIGHTKRRPHCNSDDSIQYLLRAEKQLLQSISARGPLPEVLNRICSALDCEIGDMVSFISLADEVVTHLPAMAGNAALFGLYTFSSAGLVAENDELLGSLEVYCCVPRHSSPWEFQLIERARCLAAIAIKRHNEASHHDNCCIHGDRPVRGRVLEWPVSMN